MGQRNKKEGEVKNKMSLNYILKNIVSLETQKA